MKRVSIFGILNVLAFILSAQSKGPVMASVSGVDRMTLVKSSIDVPSWHEKAFWPLYENYLQDISEVSSSTYRLINALAKADKTISDQEAYGYGTQILSFRKNELNIRKRHYQEISSSLNGIIAMQFLQTEALLDMVESSGIYDATSWRNYRFHPKALPQEQIKIAKRNIITAALSISAEQKEAFWNVYDLYEDEVDATLGEDYSIFSLYAGDASDFTPALSKRLGNDLLNLEEREIKLKEKYFLQMKETVGSSLAARFLAWEDYYSIVSKMYVFAEN